MPLSNTALEQIRETISTEWSYNSNSIEGSTLSLKETQMMLQDRKTIKGKSLREHIETHNHKKAIDHLFSIVNEEYQLQTNDILSLHTLVMRSIEDEYAGRFRNTNIHIPGANFDPPNANKVAFLVEELIEYTNQNTLGFNDIELTTLFYHKLSWIHPFLDGNRRTIRLSMNLILMRSGFPPAIFLKNDKKKLNEGLNQANNGNYQKLLLLVCQALERSLNIYLNAIPESNSFYQKIADIVNEPNNSYSQEYISLLARTGKIDAYKEGRSWYTSKEAIEDYIENH